MLSFCLLRYLCVEWLLLLTTLASKPSNLPSTLLPLSVEYISHTKLSTRIVKYVGVDPKQQEEKTKTLLKMYPYHWKMQSKPDVDGREKLCKEVL